MAGGDLLGISSSGVLAAKQALSTTGHNIANSSTEGYTRQRVELDARKPQLFGNSVVGTGVLVDNVNRVYDEFLVSEVRDSTTRSSFLDSTHTYTKQLDDTLADPKAGLNPAITNFFDAVNGVANDPSSTAARQVLISNANNLSDRFHFMETRFESIRKQTNNDMRGIVGEINEISSAIADINNSIVQARGVTDKPANDLLDQRERLVKELAERINVRVTEQDDGRINVFVGNGQTLVIGDIATRLELSANEYDPTEMEVEFVSAGGNINISQFLTGGQLGGIFKFRDELLDPAQNELGRIAIGIAKTFNEQHRLGMDLSNKLGTDFFNNVSELAPVALPSSANKGDAVMSVDITSTDKLTTSDYQLNFVNGEYELLRLVDDQVVSRFNSLPQNIDTDGFNLKIESGSMANGDRFLIRPSRRGADRFDVDITSVDKVAAAAPIRVQSDIDNLGDAEIEVVQVTGTDNEFFRGEPGKLSPPYVIQFTDENHFKILDNKGQSVKVKVDAQPDDPDIDLHNRNGAIPATPASETGDKAIPATPADPQKKGKKDKAEKIDGLSTLEGEIKYDPNGVTIFPTKGGIDRGIQIKIKGEPKAGDVFTIEYNTDGVGDNKNMVALSELQTKPVLMGGTSDYAQTYGQLVSRVGSKTHELEINREAQNLLLDQAVAAREEVSGVNIDEEAAQMVRYQNLYQANAQVVATANRVFQTLLDAFR